MRNLLNKAVFLMMFTILFVNVRPMVFAAEFSSGDTVEVCNTLGLGLFVRSAPAGVEIGGKFDGDRGMVIDGPQTASYEGVDYTWWKIRWGSDALEGWSAGGYPGGVDYLEKVTVSPWLKFSIGDFVKVDCAGVSGLAVRTDPPALFWDTSAEEDDVGKIVGGPFYGVAFGMPGFCTFWKVDYGTSLGWSDANYLVKTTVPRMSVNPSSIVNESLVPGDLVTLEINVTGIQASHGACGIQFRLEWDSTVLNGVSGSGRVPVGHFMDPDGSAEAEGNLWRVKPIGVGVDHADYAVTFYDLSLAIAHGDAPRYGGGVLATLALRVVSIGWTVIALKETVIGDINANPIVHSAENGVFGEKPSEISIGDWVQTTANLNVRISPGLSYLIIDTMPLGTIGQIMGGPVEADGYFWWEVDYVEGVSGWSAGNWLVLAPPNQPPVADFTSYPQQPEAMEEVAFDASSSYDLDGGVVFYEWDWDGDGVFDDFTESPTITFWWVEDGTYDVRLRVINDKGATNITHKEVTVSKTTFWWTEEEISKASEAAVNLAFYIPPLSWWYTYKPPIPKDDKLAITQIDTWIRDGKGKPLDWFKPYTEADLARLLNAEVDSDQSPGLTFKVFARSKIFEGKSIAEASVFLRDPYGQVQERVIKPLFEYVYKSIWRGTGLSIGVDAVKRLFPIVGFGLQSILFALSTYKLQRIANALNKQHFVTALAWYLFMRAGNNEPAAAWDYCSHWVEWAITTKEVPIAEGKEREDMLVEIQSYYEKLWEDYKEKLQHIGSWESFLRADKDQLKSLLLSEFRKRFLAEGPERRIVNVASPVELRVYDSEGRITGVTNEEVRVEIPYSVYNSNTKTATIFLPSGPLMYEVVGTDTGTYGLEVTSVGNGQIINFTAVGILTSVNATHQYVVDWAALYVGEEGVTVCVDSNGDGEADHVFTSGSELTHFPGDVSMDGQVNILDVVVAANAFGSRTGEDRWNQAADENLDGRINVLDLILIAREFGKRYV